MCGVPGTAKAKEVAEKFRFNPDGRAEAGFPVSYGLTTVERSYWFHETADESRRREIINAAYCGDETIYRCPHHKPTKPFW